MPGAAAAALERLAAAGVRRVQLSASQVTLRPRELDRSGRRDLLILLRRLELSAGGLDAWVPTARLNTPLQLAPLPLPLAKAG